MRSNDTAFQTNSIVKPCVQSVGALLPLRSSSPTSSLSLIIRTCPRLFHGERTPSPAKTSCSSSPGTSRSSCSVFGYMKYAILFLLRLMSQRTKTLSCAWLSFICLS